MDIKEKLKTFIDKQKVNLKASTSHHNLQDSVTQEEFEGRTAVISNQHRGSTCFGDQKLTPEAEKAVIDSIESLYFENNGLDVSEHELNKFPDQSDIHVINGIRSRLRKQQAVVSRCVSNLILQKQGLCGEEIERISDIQKELHKAIEFCVEGRTNLKQGRTQFTTASLGILANYSKRQRVRDVIESLRTIHTLQMTDDQLQKLLKAEDYPGAIHLLLECQRVAIAYKHFKCISELSTKLQDTLEIAEEQLDSAVSKVALNFNSSLYEKLFIAYGLFNKTQKMMDQLHMHLTSHIHNTAFNIILGYVHLYNTNSSLNGNEMPIPSFSKLQYSELCKYVNQECFLPCFLDLSKGMWNILRNYQNIIKWHNHYEQSNCEVNQNINDSKSKEEEECRKYIKQKLDHGLLRLWQDVQAKVRTFILASNLSHFKFDDFLKVLDVINKLIDVGDAFCGSKSENLQDSIKTQSYNFFQSHHLARMEELHMFLDNEGWEICPVKSTFSINQLIEYKFLKTRNGNLTSRSTPAASPKKGNLDDKKDLFEYYEEGSPFDVANDDSIEEDIMAEEGTESAISDEDSDDDIPEELRKDFVDEQTDDKPQNTARKKNDIHKTPMVTNTTLNILRLFGKYIQMMRLLQPIAFDVLISLCQLFEYFMYAVFTLFTDRKTTEQSLSPRLRTTLKRIEDTLILNLDVDSEENRQNKIPGPTLCPQILKDSPESLYSLPVRVIAVESLAFLSQQLDCLHSHIELLLPASKRTFLQQFYTNSVMMTSEVQYHVYMYVASRVIDYDGLLSQMSTVKWDISDLQSQHSPYVDVLLRQLQILTMRLEELKKTHPLPAQSLTLLWKNIIRYTNKVLLEGFASTKKCTNEGRSLMQLDYQQYLMKLECMTMIRPLPDRHMVETFIKAYYLPENALEEWINSNHNQYATKQLIALTSCMTHVSKKMRQRIANLLEENGAKKS